MANQSVTGLLKQGLPRVGDTYDPKQINAVINVLENTLSKPNYQPVTTGYAEAAIYNMEPSDQYIISTYSATGTQTINLIAAALRRGIPVTIKDGGGSAGTNNITIKRSGGDSIDGGTTDVISTNFGKVTLMPDGSSVWYT